MAITRARIRNFKQSHKGRYRPSMDLNSKEAVIDKIMTSLYQPHLQYFHKRLTKLIEENMAIKGRQGEARNFGLAFAGKSWFVPWMKGLTESDYNILPVDPGLDETELIKVTANLGELDIEMYEVQRFLVNLLTFSAPLGVMEDKLGRSLFNRVKEFLAEIEGTGLWNEAQHKAFNTYVEEHDCLIDAMCNRIMMTMLSQNAFNQR